MMTYEVLVVGGGIGGLTAAALLAARGVNVCVLEKESRAGGCAASFEKLGYSFEQGAGLYASWQKEEIHERVFAELPVNAPEVIALSQAYTVRLPDQTLIPISVNDEEFEESLRASFPECAAEAVRFYRKTKPIGEALQRMARKTPNLRTSSRAQRLRLLASEARTASRLLKESQHTAAQHLAHTSMRFRRFIDVQLQIFAQCSSQTCAYLYAALALTIPRQGMYSMRGGAQSLIDALVEAIKQSGGTVRPNTPVLRLAYDRSGSATGVDLLSGERLEAKRAIISNLTVWDTYGKLVGATRTPSSLRARLKDLTGWGAYLLFLSIDEERASQLAHERLLTLTDWQEDQEYHPENAQFMFSCAPVWDRRAPAGQRAVTVSAYTEAEQWFGFHEDETEHEEQDQQMLEALWQRLHAAMPELGDAVEVIETATPRTYYEATRRKLGMVGGLSQSLDLFGANSFSHETIFPNLYMVGDTVFPGNGIAAVTQSALIVANEIAPLK